jgi:hypothetical protein
MGKQLIGIVEAKLRLKVQFHPKNKEYIEMQNLILQIEMRSLPRMSGQ